LSGGDPLLRRLAAAIPGIRVLTFCYLELPLDEYLLSAPWSASVRPTQHRTIASRWFDVSALYGASFEF